MISERAPLAAYGRMERSYLSFGMPRNVAAYIEDPIELRAWASSLMS
eukprot:COSAG02_NODE_800_length_17049_cov_14.510737_3_plen_47_part_00